MEPRSAADFIEIAKQFNTVLVNAVPALDDDFRDPTRRFIYLVDEFMIAVLSYWCALRNRF